MIITNKQELPSAFVNMAKKYSEYTPTPKQYSATTLLKPVRIVILERRYGKQITQDVSDMIWLLFGQAVHYILEHHDETGWAEKRLKHTLENGYTLSGIIDLYNEETQTVVDYKTCSVSKVRNKNYGDWKLQGLMYAWLLKHNGYECKKAIFYPIMKDHSPADRFVKEDYPEHAVGKYEFDITEENLQEIDAFIREKLDMLAKIENLPDNELPMCSDDEVWRTPTKYAVKKSGSKKATKIFRGKKALEEAEEYIRQNDKKNYLIEVRKGFPQRCFNYCQANQYCPYYRELMLGKEDVIDIENKESEENETNE